MFSIGIHTCVVMATPLGENAPSTARDGIVLPMLSPRVCYQAVPRRYEETKLVINQDFTHRKIIGTVCHIDFSTIIF